MQVTFFAVCCLLIFVNLPMTTAQDFNVSSYTNSPFGNDSFVFEFENDAVMSTVIQCNCMEKGYYIVAYWNIQGRREALFYAYRWWSLGDTEVHLYPFKGANVSWAMSAKELRITITLTNVNITANQSTIEVKEYDYYHFYYVTPPITVVCCDSAKDQLELVGPHGNHGEADGSCLTESLAVCKIGSAFHSETGEYLSAVNVKCKLARWTGTFQCLTRFCTSPEDDRYLTTKSSFPQYKVGYKLPMKCRNGRMYTWKASTRLIDVIDFTCLESETWSERLTVGCWEGSTVDFTYPNITLHSGQHVIFACKARSPLNVEIIVGNEKFYGKKTAWANISMMPDHNGVLATCQEIDYLNRTIYERMTYLNVQYAPRLKEDVEQLYTFEPGTTGHVIIRFDANPVVGFNDVKIFKNGEYVPNYYLEVDGVNHRMVLDFEKVVEDDFGLYVITVTSHPPVQATLIANVTITLALSQESSTLNAESIAAVVLAIILLGTVLGGITYFYRMRRQNIPQNQSKKPDINVAYEGCEQHNYEDILDNSVNRNRPPESGYENFSVTSSATKPNVKRTAKDGRYVPAPNQREKVALPVSGKTEKKLQTTPVEESAYEC